jgi:hypothetical protein
MIIDNWIRYPLVRVKYCVIVSVRIQILPPPQPLPHLGSGADNVKEDLKNMKNMGYAKRKVRTW